MDETQTIILYLLLFRLAVVAAGVIAIVLGYRLFIHGSQVLSTGENDEEIGVKIGTAEFTLKNVAPGTCFAIFGAALIVTMLIKAPPEVTRSADGERFRGDELETAWQPPKVDDQPEPSEIDSFWRERAVSLNDMAWYLYEHNSHLELAESLVKISIVSDPGGEHADAFTDTHEKIRTRLTSQ